MKQAYSVLRSHIIGVFTYWKVQHLAQSMLDSSTLEGSQLMETMCVTCSRVGFPTVLHLVLIDSCKLWSQEGSERNLCIIIEHYLHLMLCHFLQRHPASSCPHLIVILRVYGQLRFGENFYSVPAQIGPNIIFTAVLWSKCHQSSHITEEETEAQRSEVPH